MILLFPLKTIKEHISYPISSKFNTICAAHVQIHPAHRVTTYYCLISADYSRGASKCSPGSSSLNKQIGLRNHGIKRPEINK